MSNQANLINLEILRMARDLVTNEYIDRRAQLHNQWLKDSNDQFTTLPYPDIPPYPTENDVVTRAQKLLNFLLDNSVKVGGAVGASALTNSAIGKIIEPTVSPVTEPVLQDVVVDCTGPTGASASDINEATCTGMTSPTGASASDITEETCTGVTSPTGASASDITEETCTGMTSPTGTATTESPAPKSKSKNKVPMPPDEYGIKYALYKSNHRDNDEATTIGNIIPDLMRNIKNNSVV